MNKDKIKFIAVSGYGWSGSSAVVDLFRELENVKCVDTEFRLIKDPYGLLNLQSVLVENWDFLNADIALKDFLWFVEKLSKKSGIFSGYGGGYAKRITKRFFQLSKEYVDELTDFSFYATSLVLEQRKRTLDFLKGKIKRKLSLNYGELMRFSRPTKRRFLQVTKSYLSKIFDDFLEKSKSEYIVLDQAIPISNADRCFDYFDDMKLIIVDRDPRDIFIDLLRSKSLIGYELGISKNVKKYIEWHEKLRQEDISNYRNSSRIMSIRFEDLILNYEKTIQKIFSFIDLNVSHIRKKEFLDPEISKENVGMWRNYNNKYHMELIYNSLKKYCYDL